MPGRLQKVAALGVAAWAFAPFSFADEPEGRITSAVAASIASISALQAQRDLTALELSRSDADERWSLRAGSYRGAWDPAAAGYFPRFDWRSALAGDVARARVDFDWQRRLAGGHVEGGAFARLARTEVGDAVTGSSTALAQRMNESRFGATLHWTGTDRIAGLPVSPSFAVNLRSTGRDAQGGASDERGELRLFRRDRLDESEVRVSAGAEVALPLGVRAQAGARIDAYRIAVRSDDATRSGMASAVTPSPYFILRAPSPFGGDMFLSLSRGPDVRNIAAIDPRNGAPIARLDPAAGMDTIEIGFRRRLPLGIETTVSMFRARSDYELMLAGENAITEFSRPTMRQGVQLAAHYEPASWLTVDTRASALHARFADGATEYVPGTAERSASVAAALRLPGRWTAGIALNYLGKRAGIDEVTGLRNSTFVNARFTHAFSKRTTMTLDVFNLFDQRLRDIDYFAASRMAGAAGADAFLNPAEPRGLRLNLRTTF